MTTNYVTFGSDHQHNVGEAYLDQHCVARYESDGSAEGRQMAFNMFGPQFAFHYTQDFWEDDSMKWYRRGYIDLTPETPDGEG